MPILNLKYIKTDKVREKNINKVCQEFSKLSELEQNIVLFYILEAIKNFNNIGYSEILDSIESINELARLGKNPLDNIEDFKEISLALINLSSDNVLIYGDYWDEVRTINSSWLNIDNAPFDSESDKIIGYVGNLIIYYGEDVLKFVMQQGIANLNIKS